MLRLGLCCKFHKEKIKFREIRYIHFKKLSLNERWQKLDEIILDNLEALSAALQFCYQSGIFAFRIGSFLFPLYTHPEGGYTLEDLPSQKQIYAKMALIKQDAQNKGIRLSFHPDQFVILNSPREEVVEAAIKDLEHHDQLAHWLGADVINIHAGGVYGDKVSALRRLEHNLERLSPNLRSKLTFENDDKNYTPNDLYPLCKKNKIPLVYDVHHHRCLPDPLGEIEATKKALSTWDREPLFHISSPKDGWTGPKPSRHHDYIQVDDFPPFWKEIGPLTVDIEAKAKEEAVLKLKEELKL